MNKLIYTEFFTFSLKRFIIFTQAVIIYTGDLIPIEDKSIPFRFFLTFRILLTSFCLKNVTMTHFGHWQSSVLEESLSISSFLSNWIAVSSSSEFLIDSERPLSSKNCRLEYWQLLQHCRSNERILSFSFELTCLEMQSFDSIFS